MSWKLWTTFSKMSDLDCPSWLDEGGRRVFAATLPKVKNPTPEQLEMLAAYSEAMVNLRGARNDPERARVWRGAMLYARNGLELGARVFVDLLELLIDWPGGAPDPITHLKIEWQLPESERPEDYMTIPSTY